MTEQCSPDTIDRLALEVVNLLADEGNPTMRKARAQVLIIDALKAAQPRNIVDRLQLAQQTLTDAAELLQKYYLDGHAQTPRTPSEAELVAVEIARATEQDAEISASEVEFFDELRRRRAQSPGWQPIETAPKDRFILLYCPEDASRWLAKWQGGEWYGTDCEHGITRTGYSAGNPDVVTGWAVSHWRDVPPVSSTDRGDS